MNLDFHIPVKFISGENCIINNSTIFSDYGKKCIIVTGKASAIKSGALADVKLALDSCGIEYIIFDGVEPNPILETAWNAGKIARDFGAKFVIGIGGGSPLDASKAIAVFTSNEMQNCMEIYDINWANDVLPIIAVGTTAGTGSEVNSFVVMTMPNGMKQSFASIKCAPAIAFGDPKYTYSLPRNFTISTALDAMSHCLEAYFNVKANVMSDMFAVQALRILTETLSELKFLPENQEISHNMREKLYYASVLAGIALGRCGTCYCHRLGYYLTENYDVAHGTACAVFLPGFIRRANKLMPQRAQVFFADIRCDEKTLCDLIEFLNLKPKIKFDTDTIAEIAKRGTGSVTFSNTAPEGFGEQDAIEALKIFA